MCWSSNRFCLCSCAHALTYCASQSTLIDDSSSKHFWGLMTPQYCLTKTTRLTWPNRPETLIRQTSRAKVQGYNLHSAALGNKAWEACTAYDIFSTGSSSYKVRKLHTLPLPTHFLRTFVTCTSGLSIHPHPICHHKVHSHSFCLLQHIVLECNQVIWLCDVTITIISTDTCTHICVGTIKGTIKEHICRNNQRTTSPL